MVAQLDLLSALLAIGAPNHSNEIIYQIHNIINSNQKTVEFMWVPSHTAIPENQKVDILPRPNPYPLPTTLLYQDIKRSRYQHSHLQHVAIILGCNP